MTLSFPRLIAALTLLAVFTMAARPSADTDTWWHLRAGQWIVEHRAVPMTDPFSHTRAGAEWKYPGWLIQAPMYGLFWQFGFAGLNLFTAFFVTLGFACVYLACVGHPLLRAFTLIVAAAAASVFWSARPQIVSFALASVFAYSLHRFRWHGSQRLWILIPLMALWANSHGGFAIGFLFLGLTWIGQVLALGGRWVGAWRTGVLDAPAPGDRGLGGVARLTGVALACAVAVALNPAGPAMLLYPFKTVSIGVLREFIQEWQSPSFHDVRAQLFLWLLFGTLGAVGLSRRRANLTDLVLVSGLAYAGFLAWRNVPLLAIAAPPVFTRHASAVWTELRLRAAGPARPAQPLPDQHARILHWALLGVVTLACLAKIALDLRPEVNRAEAARTVPIGAADYVRINQPPGRLFNAYNFGGYLAWALYPDYPVFVDGRTDLYEDAFLREYLAVAFARPGFEAVLAKYDVNLVLVEADSVLGDRLAASANWRRAYRDLTAVVYQRVPP